MKNKRAVHKNQIMNFNKQKENKVEFEKSVTKECTSLPISSAKDVEEAFDDIILPKKRKIDDLYKKEQRKKFKDSNYIPYVSEDKYTEEG